MENDTLIWYIITLVNYSWLYFEIEKDFGGQLIELDMYNI